MSTVDIDLLQMEEDEKEQWQRRSIYKLPACVTKENKKAYTPQVVSFGPYHCTNQNLKPMEKHKDRALKHFLKRSGVTHERCLQSLSGIVRDLMDAYDSLDSKLRQNPKAFLELMIRDGCFMLEIFRAWQEKLPDYAANDPIFSDHGRLHVMPHIRLDMLMLENQLPMKVLHKLHQLQNMKEDDANKLVFQFFFPANESVPSDSLHILDMYRKVILGPNPRNKKKSGTPDVMQKKKNDLEPLSFQDRTKDDIIPKAVELYEAGIKIKRVASRSITEITFEKGELCLPIITLDDQTEPLLLNLIAYERFHVGAGNQVTDYMFFMGRIIVDAQDIRHLYLKDIIQNGIGTDEAAAELFNSLSKDIVLDKNSPLGHVFEEVNSYCEQRIPKQRAMIKIAVPLIIIATISIYALTVHSRKKK